jgi:tetratricopeptide (TPR) repeat protein
MIQFDAVPNQAASGNGAVHFMKRTTLLGCSRAAIMAVAISILSAVTSPAIETDLLGLQAGGALFSTNFFVELRAADQSADPAADLKALHHKFTKPAEQAEIELTLARFFSQRTGHVDPAEAVKWYDQALVRDLPATALAKQFIFRGNMHERLGDHEKALSDYARGLLACLQFNLPDSWPKPESSGKLQPPPNRSWDEFDNGQTETRLLARRQQGADYRRDAEMTRREQDLLQARYYYIDAIKRVLKQDGFSEARLQAIAEKLTNRKDRIDELLRRVHEPNPRPWP